uniref:hypothetical protein n=1 Tax=Jatropha curcas TaxID=180498 RepID=UPI0027A807AA|nr:hypothetical protein QLP06_mgp078 [Jatropha curcas]WFG81161.1 hypothetical protein [Jatropha curcas]
MVSNSTTGSRHIFIVEKFLEKEEKEALVGLLCPRPLFRIAYITDLTEHNIYIFPYLQFTELCILDLQYMDLPEKPFLCEECNRTFTSPLTFHISKCILREGGIFC